MIGTDSRRVLANVATVPRHTVSPACVSCTSSVETNVALAGGCMRSTAVRRAARGDVGGGHADKSGGKSGPPGAGTVSERHPASISIAVQVPLLEKA